MLLAVSEFQNLKYASGPNPMQPHPDAVFRPFQKLIRSAVPNPNLARAVFARRNRPLEITKLQRVILDLNRCHWISFMPRQQITLRRSTVTNSNPF